ncbi:ABC transporter ATP-binding protein [Mycoplasma sp. E35C]|uniref:ABC transporter ATP-binding protein n=1 Tax=Mycoplasma sp. E35C TaxID=2801918 RepID=UPI0021042783|nr:ABC transporter ATP-binding protein [Mycoplasma sp. E35C]
MNINAEIYDGELVSILGPSGSGKTTLLNTIAGFIKPKSGDIKISNFNSINDIDIGFVFQNSILYEEISVYKNIYLSLINSFHQYYSTYLDCYLKNDVIDNNKYQELKNLLEKSHQDQKLKIQFKKELFLINLPLFFKENKKYFAFKRTLKQSIRQQIFDIANRLNITDILNSKASNLSGGQRQRVAIAKSLIKRVKLILLDEPFASLDAKIKEKSRDWLRTIQKEFAITMILVTHDQNDAMLVSDRIMFINQKTIAQFDKPDTIYNHPVDLSTAKFIGFPEIIKIANKNDLYIRPDNLLINKDEASTIKIKDIQNMGAQDIIEFSSDLFESSVKVIVKANSFRIGDQISVTYDENKALVLK